MTIVVFAASADKDPAQNVQADLRSRVGFAQTL